MFPACSQRYQKRDVTVLISFDFLTVPYSLWFIFTLQKCPPLTKGFREEEQNNDSIRLFSVNKPTLGFNQPSFILNIVCGL